MIGWSPRSAIMIILYGIPQLKFNFWFCVSQSGIVKENFKIIMKTVGIIGGLGPETTSNFYLKIINKCRINDTLSYPPIVIYSLPVPYQLEQDIVKFGKNENQILPLLIDGIQRLEKSGADFCVVPCGTIHIFINELRKSVSIPILSILEETARHIKSLGMVTVGLLATTKTVETNLYQPELQRQGIQLIIPESIEQEKISEIIFNILNGAKTESDKAELLTIIQNLQSKGCKAVILGCTDIPLLIDQKDTSIPLLDTVEILADSSVKAILKD